MLTETTKALIREDAKEMTLCELLQAVIEVSQRANCIPGRCFVNRKILFGNLRMLIDMGLATEGGKITTNFRLVDNAT